MRVNLNVPFAEKDAAKKRGAKWDGARRTEQASLRAEGRAYG